MKKFRVAATVVTCVIGLSFSGMALADSYDEYQAQMYQQREIQQYQDNQRQVMQEYQAQQQAEQMRQMQQQLQEQQREINSNPFNNPYSR